MEELPQAGVMAAQLASQLAASVYDYWRLEQPGEAMGATPTDTVPEGRIDAAINTAARAETAEKALNVINGRIGYETRNAYSTTLFANAKADKSKPKYARVPSGTETCGFCIMLASRGYVYAHGKSGQKVHNHANCRCVYVVQWDKSPKVQGYDPKEYYQQYKDMLKGYELDDSHLLFQRQHGKLTKKLYKPAAYDYGEAIKSSRSVGAAYSKAYAEYNEYLKNVDLSKMRYDKQMQHIEGTKQYLEELSRGHVKSCFTGLSYDDIVGMIRKYSGSGEPMITSDGSWNKIEVIYTDHVIGYTINAIGKREPTKSFTIRYSNKGVHAVPKYDDRLKNEN